MYKKRKVIISTVTAVFVLFLLLPVFQRETGEGISSRQSRALPLVSTSNPMSRIAEGLSKFFGFLTNNSSGSDDGSQYRPDNQTKINLGAGSLALASARNAEPQAVYSGGGESYASYAAQSRSEEDSASPSYNLSRPQQIAPAVSAPGYHEKGDMKSPAFNPKEAQAQLLASIRTGSSASAAQAARYNAGDSYSYISPGELGTNNSMLASAATDNRELLAYNRPSTRIASMARAEADGSAGGSYAGGFEQRSVSLPSVSSNSDNLGGALASFYAAAKTIRDANTAYDEKGKPLTPEQKEQQTAVQERKRLSEAQIQAIREVAAKKIERLMNEGDPQLFDRPRDYDCKTQCELPQKPGEKEVNDAQKKYEEGMLRALFPDRQQELTADQKKIAEQFYKEIYLAKNDPNFKKQPREQQLAEMDNITLAKALSTDSIVLLAADSKAEGQTPAQNADGKEIKYWWISNPKSGAPAPIVSALSNIYSKAESYDTGIDSTDPYVLVPAETISRLSPVINDKHVVTYIAKGTAPDVQKLGVNLLYVRTIDIDKLKSEEQGGSSREESAEIIAQVNIDNIKEYADAVNNTTANPAQQSGAAPDAAQGGQTKPQGTNNPAKQPQRVVIAQKNMNPNPAKSSGGGNGQSDRDTGQNLYNRGTDVYAAPASVTDVKPLRIDKDLGANLYQQRVDTLIH